MKKLVSFLTILIAPVILAPETAYAKPPLCQGEIGICSWETLLIDGRWHMMTECPGDAGTMHLITYGDALALCSGR